MIAVTFDVGQVLLAFDAGFLAEKLSALGHGADARRLEEAEPAAWEAYGRALGEGGHGAVAWKLFLLTLMTEGGAPAAATPQVLDALFLDQREHNVWRRPVEGVIEIARELRASGVPVGIVSNSEGALERLLAQVGYAADFDCVADSGVLGMEKPGPEIFRWAADRLRVRAEELVHVGDSWAGDVEGALGVGARAIWFPAIEPGREAAGVACARSPREIRSALARWGAPIAA